MAERRCKRFSAAPVLSQFALLPSSAYVQGMSQVLPDLFAISCLETDRWVAVWRAPLGQGFMRREFSLRESLYENRKRKRDRKTRSGWLLQGLAVCCGCGYAYCGKAVPRSRKEPSRKLRYYLCSGSEGYRFGGSPPCANRSVRADQLEEIVWGEVRALLEDPSRVEGEYRRRLAATRDGIAMPEEIARLDRQSATLRRGIERLIDSYAEGVIEKSEFTPRIAGLKQRLSQLEERRQAAEDAAGLERDLSLIISRMEDFAEKVVKGLDNLDCDGKREIVRTVVRRIEIDQNNVEVIFRVPPNGGSPDPGALNMSRALQHCTDVRRAHVRVAWTMQAPGQGLGKSQPPRPRIPTSRVNQVHAEKAMQSNMIFPDKLSASRAISTSRRMASERFGTSA